MKATNTLADTNKIQSTNDKWKLYIEEELVTSNIKRSVSDYINIRRGKAYWKKKMENE